MSGGKITSIGVSSFIIKHKNGSNYKTLHVYQTKKNDFRHTFLKKLSNKIQKFRIFKEHFGFLKKILDF
jgi:hypothetical protein